MFAVALKALKEQKRIAARERMKKHLTMQQYQPYMGVWAAQELLKVTKKHSQVFVMETLDQLDAFLTAVTIPVGFEGSKGKIKFCVAASNFLGLGWNLWKDITHSRLENHFGSIKTKMSSKRNGVAKAIWALVEA